MDPMVRAAVAKASVTRVGFVTSMGMAVMVAEGKSWVSVAIALLEVERVVGRSRIARFERPCSRRARAAARASVPAPPVTVVLF